MFYLFLKILVFPVIKLIWVGKVEGIENIPKKGGCIIAANHESYFDFITLFCISPRRIYFLAGEVFFKKWQWAWLVKLTKQIRVNRDSNDKSMSVNTAVKYLHQGKVIGIFPEGTRSKDGKLQKAYNGAVILAKKTGVPIIPVGIKGTFEIMSRHDNFPKFKKCQLFFGEPLDLKNNDNIINNNESLSKLTVNLMKKIGYLCNKHYEE